MTSERRTASRVGRATPALTGALLLMAGCAGWQSALDPAGPQAHSVLGLFWFMLVISAVVYLLVVGSLLYGTWRAHRRAASGDAESPAAPRDERTLTRVVGLAVALTVLTLFVFLFVNFRVVRAYDAMPHGDPLRVQVIGHQWWWEVHYLDSVPQRRFETANELHVPVGRPVVVELSSPDVIHSLWVPNLAGKRDLLPGYNTSLTFVADTPGVYRGQCAEFCGHQHAKMALFVIAEPEEEFQAWAGMQRQPASQPTDSVQLHGQQVFLSGPCVMCHAIEGTTAQGKTAPNLTHLASRLTIAAGTLPNTRGHLAGWIVDPQRIKPGVNMPPNQLEPRDLQALLTYLRSLR